MNFVENTWGNILSDLLIDYDGVFFNKKKRNNKGNKFSCGGV